MKKIILFAMLCVPLPAFAQQACTEIGCVDGLTLTVDPNREFEPGRYDLYFSIDGRQTQCNGNLPLKKCEDGQTFTCNKPGVLITESGCALPSRDQKLGDIHINGDPKKVLVRITRNLKPMLTRTIITKYEITRPNGVGCGPICKSASYDLFSAMGDKR